MSRRQRRDVNVQVTGPLPDPQPGYATRDVPYAVNCPICSGSGKIYTLGHFGETCPQCEGAGKVMAMRRETVPLSEIKAHAGSCAVLPVLFVAAALTLVHRGLRTRQPRCGS